MSVPVNQRSHGKLEACVKAHDLAVYTLRITKNKKIFTTDYQECLTDHIISAALNIYIFSKAANDLTVRTPQDRDNFDERCKLQKLAIIECGNLMSLILLAKPIFHLSSKRVKYWHTMTKETRCLIKAWSDSDKKRFAPLFDA